MISCVVLPGSQLWRASARFLLRHSAQAGLTVLGIALGVCVIFAVDIANISAKRAFQLSAEALTGTATHQIYRESATLAEDTYVRLRRNGVRNIAPVVEGDVALDHEVPRILHVFGVDPLAEAPIRPFGAAVGGVVGMLTGIIVPIAVCTTVAAQVGFAFLGGLLLGPLAGALVGAGLGALIGWLAA